MLRLAHDSRTPPASHTAAGSHTRTPHACYTLVHTTRKKFLTWGHQNTPLHRQASGLYDGARRCPPHQRRLADSWGPGPLLGGHRSPLRTRTWVCGAGNGRQTDREGEGRQVYYENEANEAEFEALGLLRTF